MKSKKFLTMTFVILLLTACSQTLETMEPATVEIDTTQTSESEVEIMIFVDDLGREVELSGYPRAIVSIAPSATEILFAVGAGDQIVGRDDMSLFLRKP